MNSNYETNGAAKRIMPCQCVQCRGAALTSARQKAPAGSIQEDIQDDIEKLWMDYGGSD